jgi:hypothetical protein
MTGPRLFPTMLWTPEEDGKLRSMLLAGRTAAEIAIKLRRSVSAVQVRARRIRLSFKQVKASRRLVEMGLKARK